jgi:hypothetical protein
VSKCLKGEKGTQLRIFISKCVIVGEGIGSLIFKDVCL